MSVRSASDPFIPENTNQPKPLRSSKSDSSIPSDRIKTVSDRKISTEPAKRNKKLKGELTKGNAVDLKLNKAGVIIRSSEAPKTAQEDFIKETKEILTQFHQNCLTLSSKITGLWDNDDIDFNESLHQFKKDIKELQQFSNSFRHDFDKNCVEFELDKSELPLPIQNSIDKLILGIMHITKLNEQYFALSVDIRNISKQSNELFVKLKDNLTSEYDIIHNKKLLGLTEQEIQINNKKLEIEYAAYYNAQNEMLDRNMSPKVIKKLVKMKLQDHPLYHKDIRHAAKDLIMKRIEIGKQEVENLKRLQQMGDFRQFM